MLLWALKPAEEGIDQGLIVRLWNVSDGPAEARLRLTPGARAAREATHVETDQGPVTVERDGSIDARFAPQQMRTFRLTPAGAASSPAPR